MGLISKTAMVKWNSKIKKWYEYKGYVYTEMKDEFDVKVEDLTDGSKTLVTVVCDGCGKELKEIPWKNYLKCVKEDGKYYCQQCATELLAREKMKKIKLSKSKSFEQWCIENNRQDILDRWDYKLNNCKPSEVSYGSKNKYLFKCPKGIHKSELKNISSFTSGQEGSMYCNKCNSFAQWCIDNLGGDFLEKYWDYDKNEGIDPWSLSYASSKKAHIKCQQQDHHGSYKISCDRFSRGDRCPCCSGKKIHPKDSIGQYIVDNFGEDFLNSIWSDKNDKSAFEYSKGSSKKVWWRCRDGVHNDFYRGVKESNNYEFRCPECVRERDESFLQEKVRLYLESLNIGEILHEHRCTIIPKNPKTNYLLPFDNELEEIRLIVESHGKQHYKMDSFHTLQAKNNNTTPEYEFHMLKVRDRYKKIYAYINGYHYLEIPFWTDNDTEEYKQLIDNKIQEILKLSV